MKKGLIFSILIIVYTICTTSIINGQPSKKTLTEKEKIEFLIHSVETLKDAKFNRNGTLYDAPAAAKHLRMKLKKAGNSIKTANDFIVHIASKSSSSGQVYKIVFKDGKEIPAGKYFNDILKTL